MRFGDNSQWNALSAENHKDKNDHLFKPFTAKGKFDKTKKTSKS